MGTYSLRAMDVQQQLLNQFPPLDEQEPVTVAILNYNGRQDLADAILSVGKSTYRPAEILVVDDGSTDGSVSFVQSNFPDVRVVEIGCNTKMLNQVRNRALREARTRLVFLMDHDVILDPSCLSVLVSQMGELPRAAVLTPRALFHHDPSRIYVDAQRMHFLCNSVALNRDAYVAAADERPKPSIGWGTQLIDKSKAEVIGFFDEDYVMGWGDDGEFHHKIHLCGLGCYNIPTAVVYHKRELGADRIYGGIRNRWYLIIETYALRTLVLLAPALLLYEIALFSFLCLKRQWKEYLHAMWDTVRNLPRLVSKRSKIQKLRAMPDRDLLVAGSIYARQTLVNKKYLKQTMGLLNLIFEGYWKLVRRFI